MCCFLFPRVLVQTAPHILLHYHGYIYDRAWCACDSNYKSTPIAKKSVPFHRKMSAHNLKEVALSFSRPLFKRVIKEVMRMSCDNGCIERLEWVLSVNQCGKWACEINHREGDSKSQGSDLTSPHLWCNIPVESYKVHNLYRLWENLVFLM